MVTSDRRHTTRPSHRQHVNDCCRRCPSFLIDTQDAKKPLQRAQVQVPSRASSKRGGRLSGLVGGA